MLRSKGPTLNARVEERCEGAEAELLAIFLRLSEEEASDVYPPTISFIGCKGKSL